jgi:hypothetical protein
MRFDRQLFDLQQARTIFAVIASDARLCTFEALARGQYARACNLVAQVIEAQNQIARLDERIVSFQRA